MPPRFLDTNILLRYFTRDDPDKARRAFALLTRIERGDEKVITSPMVIFETVYTLQTYYRVPKPRIRGLLLPVIALRGVQLPGKRLLARAFDLYVSKNVSFADAYTAAEMNAHGLSEVYSWDTDFDKIEGVARVEPGED